MRSGEVALNKAYKLSDSRLKEISVWSLLPGRVWGSGLLLGEIDLPAGPLPPHDTWAAHGPPKLAEFKRTSMVQCTYLCLFCLLNSWGYPNPKPQTVWGPHQYPFRICIERFRSGSLSAGAFAERYLLLKIMVPIGI